MANNKPDRFTMTYWLDILQVDDLLLLLPKLICAVWAGLIANSLRKRWWGIIEIILMGKQLPGYVEGLLGLLLIVGLIFLVTKTDLGKWVPAVAWTIVLSLVAETIANGWYGLRTGGPWVIPGMGFWDWTPIWGALAQRAVRGALEKKK